MSLDPVTAVGLSAGILQFINFAAKLVDKGHEIAQSVNGATVENHDVQAVTRSLAQLVRQVSEAKCSPEDDDKPARAPSASDIEIDRLAAGCETVATELLDALGGLRLGGKKTTWRSMVQALKTVWSEAKIEGIRARLAEYRAGIHTALLMSLRQRVDDITPNLLTLLREGSQIDLLKSDILRIIRQEQRPELGLPSERDQNQRPLDELSPQTQVLKSLGRMSREERTMHLQNQILEDLGFYEQREREHGISEAHQRTFRWVFSTRQQQRKRPGDWSNFRAWLEEDRESLYWITGKAGSGKSTLMKFIVHHCQCARFLKTWSGSKKVISARFYFWNSGTQNQMSQEGLLRSVLQDALCQEPNLIAKVFPMRWKRSELFGSDFRAWELNELLEAFKKLVASADEDDFKLCLFVDGLDEFDGDLEQLISLFKLSVSFRNVKACLASRPWTVFQEAFEHRPNLQLEDLTYPDILTFVDSSFETNSGFMVLKRREPEFGENLIRNIAKKSSGVFLWVRLVVRSLLFGLTNRDRISDLQRRLDEVPEELEGFYQKIFNSIMLDKFYRERACQLFRLVDVAHGTLTVLGMSFIDEDDPKALQQPIAPLDILEAHDRIEQVKRRLNVCCKGFLEVSSTEDEEFEPDHQRTPATLKRMLDHQRRHHDLVSDGGLPPWMNKVTYLHRTVFDFLQSREIAEQIEAHAGLFDTSLPLLRSCLLVMKTWVRIDGRNHDQLKDAGRKALEYAESVDMSGRLDHHALLEEVERVLQKQGGPKIWAKLNPTQSGDSSLDFLSRKHLRSFVAARILSDSQAAVTFDKPGRPLLDCIITECEERPSYRDPVFPVNYSSLPAVPSLELICHLLAVGTDPNQEVISNSGRRSIWQNLLRECVRASLTRSQMSETTVQVDLVPRLEHWARIVEVFIKAGADPRMNLDSPQGSCIREAFGELLSQRARKLERMISRTRKRWSAMQKFILPLVGKRDEISQKTKVPRACGTLSELT